MKPIIRITVLFLTLFMLTSCTKEPTNEFQKDYGVDKEIVESMSYKEFLNFAKENTGVVFIGDDNPNTKELAQIFCDVLCECNVNKAYYVKSTDIINDEILDIIEVESLEFPVIVAFKDGEPVSYYDNNTNTDNFKQYIDDLIHSAYPAVCNEAC